MKIPSKRRLHAVEFDDAITQATTQIRPQDVLYLQPERDPEGTARHFAAGTEPERAAQDQPGRSLHF